MLKKEVGTNLIFSNLKSNVFLPTCQCLFLVIFPEITARIAYGSYPKALISLNLTLFHTLQWLLESSQEVKMLYLLFTPQLLPVHSISLHQATSYATLSIPEKVSYITPSFLPSSQPRMISLIILHCICVIEFSVIRSQNHSALRVLP